MLLEECILFFCIALNISNCILSADDFEQYKDDVWHKKNLPMSRGHRSNRVRRQANVDVLTAETKEIITDWHNNFRRNVDPQASNMNILVWSDYLEGVASAALDDASCPSPITVPPTGHPSFTSVDSWDLRTGTTETTGEYISRILNALDTAGSSYTYSSNQCSNTLLCPIYQKITWGEASHVGCGVAECRIGIRFQNMMCLYGSGQSIPTAQPYEDGTPCEACVSTHPCCDEGLCTTDLTTVCPTTTTSTTTTTTTTEPTTSTTTTEPTTTTTTTEPTTSTTTTEPTTTTTTTQPTTTTTTTEPTTTTTTTETITSTTTTETTTSTTATEPTTSTTTTEPTTTASTTAIAVTGDATEQPPPPVSAIVTIAVTAALVFTLTLTAIFLVLSRISSATFLNNSFSGRPLPRRRIPPRPRIPPRRFNPRPGRNLFSI